MNDECAAQTPGTVCSSNGNCVNGTCVCSTPGFSGMGDWRFQNGLDCDVYLPAVLALWALIAIFAGLTLISSSFQLVRIVRRQGIKASRKQRLNKIHFALCFSMLGCVITAVWRVSNISSTAIGDDVALTWIHTFTALGITALAFTVLYQFYMVQSAVVQQRAKMRADDAGRRFRTLLCVLYIIYCIPWFLAIWGLYSPLQTDTVNQVRFVLDGVNNVGYAILAPIAFNPLISALDESIAMRKQEARLKRIRANLVRVRRELIVQPTINGLVKFVFAFWPFLRRKVVYEYPVQLLLWMIMSLAVSLLIARQTSAKAVSSQDQDDGQSPPQSSPSRDGKRTLATVVNSEAGKELLSVSFMHERNEEDQTS